MNPLSHHQPSSRRKLLHRGRVFDFTRETATLDNGASVNLDMVRHPGAAAVVPMLSSSTVVLLKQYRYAAGGYIWEIPAGTLDPGETALDCARRELIEETGWSAARWHKLAEIIPVPGYSDERIQIFVAAKLKRDAQKLDRDEVLAVHQMDYGRAVDMIWSGEIQDAKTICGLLMARRWLEQNTGPGADPGR